MIRLSLRRRHLLASLPAALAAPASLRAQPAGPLFVFTYDRTVDRDQKAALEAWGQVLNRYAGAWWEKIRATLASPGFEFVDQITLEFGDITIPGVPALTRGFTIEVNIRGLLSRIRDADTLGMVAHEMVHVGQRYPHAPGWLVEGIADYMRYYVLIPDDPSRAFRPQGVSWTSGYQPSAALIDWIEQSHPGTVTRINAALRAGNDGEAVLREAAGMPLADAWAAYLASHPAATSSEALRRRQAAQRG